MGHDHTVKRRFKFMDGKLKSSFCCMILMHMKREKAFLMVQVNFIFRLEITEKVIKIGCSIYSHTRRYEYQSIPVYDDENKFWYFSPMLYVTMFGRLNTMEITDLGVPTEECGDI